MRRLSSKGFTLIELLTVIAIIAILAAIIAVAAPRALERAKIASMRNDLLQLRNSLTQYYTEHLTFPPAYGYLTDNETVLDRAYGLSQQGSRPADRELYFLKPYLSFIGLHGNTDVHDEFSESYDTELQPDGRLSRLEFSPVGTEDVATERVTFPDQLYEVGPNGEPQNLSFEVQQQLEAENRPYVYLPVNLRQYRKARQFWIETQDWNADHWDPFDPDSAALEDVQFPPPNYDAYVLLSVGPGRSSFGLLEEPNEIVNTVSQTDPQVQLTERYHIAALRAFYLATRDLNNNDVLDFHFPARTRENEAAQNYRVLVNGERVPVASQDCLAAAAENAQDDFTADDCFSNSLPDRQAPNGAGPWIFIYPDDL